MTLYEILSLLLEFAVLLILVAEYVYDARLNAHVKALKRRTKRRFDYENLTQGEMR